MSRRLSLLVFVLALLGSAVLTSAAGAARFYTPDYGSKTPEEIGGFDLGSDGSLTPIPGSPFPAEEPGFGGLWDLAFSPDGTRAMTGFLFTGGVQSFVVPPSGIFQLAGAGVPTVSVTAVAITPNGRYAFATTREFMASPAEEIRRFAFNADGSLASLSPSSGSEEYGDVAVSPDGRFLFATRANAVDRFAIGGDGSLSPLGTTPVPGAMLLATSADERFLYVMVGPGGEPGVAVYAIAGDGSLSQRGTAATLPPGSNGDLFTVAPDGRHAFIPDGNNDLIATIAIADDGSPTLVPGGMPVENPESVGVSPDGRFLVFYRGGGSDNALGSATISADGSLSRSPFEADWSTGEPEPLVFQPHPAPVARAVVETVPKGLTFQFNGSGSERAASYAWDFGDGRTSAGASPAATHSYDKAGVYTVTLTVTDANGCSIQRVYDGHSTVCPGGAAATTSFAVDTPPVLSRPKAVPKRFLAKPKGKAKGKFGTTFRYTVNEPATVRFKIERKKPGRLVGGRCKPRTAKNSSRKKCPLFKRVGSRSQAAKAGANRLKWNGRLKGTPLAAGSYRATVVATDKAGGRSAPQTVGFRILPPRQQP